MKDSSPPRGGLSVAALAVVLFVPLTVGWAVERLAYGEACATNEVVAPLYECEQRPALVGRLTASPCEAPQPKDPAVESTPATARND